MYASQWFLTLFTAKFPLFLVFHILDLFLSEGKDVIFNVSLALLKVDYDIMDQASVKCFDGGVCKRFRIVVKDFSQRLSIVVVVAGVSQRFAGVGLRRDSQVLPNIPAEEVSNRSDGRRTYQPRHKHQS